MKGIFAPMIALMWKDVLLETRTKDVVVSVLMFSLLTIVIFNFALDPSPQIIALVAPGILWVAFVFGGVLGLTRSFSRETDVGNLSGLMLAPVGRDIIFFGKMVSNFLFMLMVEVLVFPLFAVFFNLSLAPLGLIPIVILATLGIVTIGTVFSAMSANTRTREVMLPLLFFPVSVPVIIAAVEATRGVLGDVSVGDSTRWVPLLVAFDAVFLVVCPVAFHLVLEE